MLGIRVHLQMGARRQVRFRALCAVAELAAIHGKNVQS